MNPLFTFSTQISMIVMIYISYKILYYNIVWFYFVTLYSVSLGSRYVSHYACLSYLSVEFFKT